MTPELMMESNAAARYAYVIAEMTENLRAMSPEALELAMSNCQKESKAAAIELDKIDAAIKDLPNATPEMVESIKRSDARRHRLHAQAVLLLEDMIGEKAK